MRIKAPRYYVLMAVISSVLLGYAFRLSAGDRGVVDWVVAAAVAGVIVWALVGLGRRLNGVGGGRAVWHEGRTVMFWLIGLMNTLWARPEDAGSWKWWVGVVLLVAAAADTVALYLRERRVVGTGSAAAGTGTGT